MYQDDAVRLRDMLAYSREAIGILGSTSLDDFVSNRVLSLAVVRLIEIVGEAAANVSEAGRKSLPDLPWRQIIAARNRYVHAYSSLDLGIVWNVVQHDLPQLVTTIESALR